MTYGKENLNQEAKIAMNNSSFTTKSYLLTGDKTSTVQALAKDNFKFRHSD